MTETEAPPAEKKSQDALKKIAVDLHHGKIYTDRHIPENMEASMIFLPLVFMTKEQVDEFVVDLGLIYEYEDQRQRMCINGQPIFFSLNKLNKEDTDTVFEMMRKLREAEKLALG